MQDYNSHEITKTTEIKIQLTGQTLLLSTRSAEVRSSKTQTSDKLKFTHDGINVQEDVLD